MVKGVNIKMLVFIFLQVLKIIFQCLIMMFNKIPFLPTAISAFRGNSLLCANQYLYTSMMLFCIAIYDLVLFGIFFYVKQI